MLEKTTLAILVLAILLLMPLPARAQQWSAEEREILAFTEACWETFAKEDIEKYLAECTHDDYSRWSSGTSMPIDARSERRMLPPWFSRNDWTAWNIQPHRIRISGDAAVIHYQITSYRTSADGSTSFHLGGRSDFLVREDGAWKVFSVHEHAASQ